MKKNSTQLSYKALLFLPLLVILSSVYAGGIILPAVSSSIVFTNPIQNNNMFLGVENDSTQGGYTLPAVRLGSPCQEIPAGKFMYVYSNRSAVPTSATNIIISITYYDSSMNSLWINYTRNGNAGGWGTADFPESNTKQWITRIITITDAGLDGSMGYGGDIRMGFNGNNNYIKNISISVGTLDPTAQPVPAQVNNPNSEFMGKSFAGYQLWHQAGAMPQDWLHWSYGMLPAAGRGNHNTETFPHISDYNGNPNVPMYATNFANLGDGTPTKLYNSTDQGVIDVQMGLLKNAGFDGVAIQRNAPIGRAIKDTAADYCVSIKNACQNNGRLFYVMYCMPDTNNGSAHLEDIVAGIERDWVFQMEQVYALTSSSAYATVNGKPVVELWGLGYSTIEVNNPQALELAAFFKSRGCYVIAGTPRDWRLMNEGSRTDFGNVYTAYDMISPWTVGAYNDTTSANGYKTNYEVADKAYCDANGMGYYPVVFVGSAWSQPVSGYPNDTKRIGGKFLWQQALNAQSIGVKSMYFAMLDEFEESTDIINAATDYFDIPTDQYFGTLAMDGIWCSPDYYLRLGGAAARMITSGTSPATITIPYSLGPIYYRNSFESRVANCIINGTPQNIVAPIDACFYNDAVITNTGVTSPSVAIVNPAAGLTESGIYSTQITGTATGASKYYYQISQTKIAIKANMQLSFWKYSVNALGQNTSVDLTFKSGKTLHSLAEYTDNNNNAMTPTIARGAIGSWQKFTCQIGKGELIGDELDGISIAYDNPTASGNFNAYFDDIIVQDALDTTTTSPTTSAGLNYPALLGYWQDWDDPASPYIPLDQVDPKYNNVIVAFATPINGNEYQIGFTPYNVSQATFITQIQTLQSQGRKVLISIGGEGAPVSITNAAQESTFISSVESIINTYGYDGVDIDFEGTSLSVTNGSTIASPVDAPEIYLIAALKQIMQDYRAAHNKKMLLTLAPEAADVQGGMSSYGGVWGSYLPIINGLKDSLDVLQVQLYNTGSMYGLDRNVYNEGTADFIVAETEASIKGFNTAGGLFAGLPANKIAVGLPSCAGAAGGGYIDTATVHAAMNYLLGKGPKPGSYTLEQAGGYPTLEGMMDWSINYDEACSNGGYATNFQNIFDTTTIPTTSESPYGGIPWPIPGTVQAEDYDLGGEGVAYHDIDAVNQGGAFRTDGVDIETTTDVGGGYDVGYIADNEWLKYSVNVTASGTYNIGFRTASTSSSGVIRLEVDGVDVTGPVSLPNTSDYQDWVTTTVSNINLTAGLHTIRLFVITGGFNLNYFTVTAPPTGPGYLYASGKNIVNNNGNFVIKAINIGDFMIQEGYMMNMTGAQYIYKQKITAMIGATACDQFYANYYQNFITKADIDSISKMGFNSIRLPLDYELFTPLGQPTVFLTQGFTIVDSIVSWCKADNIYVILDLHAAPGGQNTGDISNYDPSQPSLWESTANQNQTVALWAKLAQRYANEPYVGGYDLINETDWTLPGNTLLMQLMQNITTAIRQVDNNHILFIEGNNYANDYTGLTPKWDNNMAYSFHKYWNDNLASTLSFALSVRDGQDVPIWMGEFGENSNNWIADAETLVNQYNIGWAIWPYKKMSSVSSVSSFQQPANWTTFANYVNGGAMPSATAGQAILNELLEDVKVANCTTNNGYLYALFKQPGNTNTIPYNNTAASLPGKITAANYDEGKNGYAYNDSLYQDTQYGSAVGSSTSWNNGWYYRNDGVDLQYSTAENAPTVGWTETNDWMQYTVNIAAAGSYNVTVRAASGAAGGKLSISSDGTTLISNAIISATGGWDTWQNFNLGNVTLPAGKHTIVATVTTPGYNLSYFNFSTLAPVITSAIAASGTTGSSFSYGVAATNTPTSFSLVGALPTGLNLNTSTGVISGIPTIAGTFIDTIKATNAAGTGVQVLTITITSPVPPIPVITSANTASGTVGTAITNYTITASNTPTSFAVINLPAGLSLNTATGVISGTPTVAGTFIDTLKATNAGGTGTRVLTITINAAIPSVPVITSATSANGTIGTAFTTYIITATNSPTSYALTGVLPAGLIFSAGAISGTPTVSGTFVDTVKATNANGTGTQTLTIIVAALVPCGTSMVVNATSAPIIDGTIDAVWSNAPKNAITKTIQGTIQTGSTWQAMYDATNLYILVQVTDANLSNVGTNIYDQDGVELFIAGNNNKTGTYTANDHQYRFNWNEPATTANITGNTGSTTGISYAIPSSTGGYTLEVAIPWITIGGTAPSNGKPIGFDVNINDQQNNLTTREAIAGWNGTATDDFSNPADFGTVNLTVCAATAPVITSAITASGTTNTSFNYSITATNTPTGYAVGGTLPTGLTLNTTTGIISGTPTAAGVFIDTVKAINAGGTGTQVLTITINPAKPLVAIASTAGTVGVSFSYTISATNNPTGYGSTTLPTGLSLNTVTGAITGTPTVAGTFTVTDTAKNISGSGTGTLTITINPAKPVVATASTTGTVGVSFSYTISATNNPTGYGSTTLPAGLSLNTATGVITGTPTTAGTFTITDTAKNISGSGTGTLTITINPAIPVVAIASTTGTVGVSFSYTISATNNPTSYGSTTLPAGLSLNTATGVITGTPTTAGTFTITDTAKNISGSGTGTLTITINPAIPVVAIASTTGTVGVSFSYTISATNNPTSYGSTTLPAGLSLNTATGVITGTPTTAGTFTITDTAKNISGSGTGILTITINPAKPVVAIASTTGTVGVSFSYTISATNNPTGYGSTTLPAGLSLNTTTGAITGTPTTAGTFTITDTAKNISGSGTGILTITINPAKPVVAIASTTGTVGVSFSYTISATNNPTSYGSTTLPAGLSLNTATGVITGTPTTAGTFTITDTAKNISGSGTGILTITINPAKPVVVIASTTGTVGVSFSYTISATNNPAGYGSTTLPAGLSLNTTTGAITGTPTTAGTFTITDTAKNISGSGTGTLTITINPAKPVVAIASTTGTVGVSFSYTISATNNPTSYGSTTLPAGLSLNTTTGAITGTPTTAGTFTITDTAKNISGSGTGILTITINPAKPVVTSTTVNGTTGVAFSYTISATNSPTSYGASTLPGGLTFNSVTGMINGTPTTVGTFTILDTAKNISGIGVGTLTIMITTTVPPAPVVTSGSVTGTVGVSFSYTIVATNSPTGYNSTTLPAGLSINSSGIISGAPTTAGTFTITDTAKNAGGNGTGTLTITINPAKPVIAIASTTGTVGISFSYTIAATNNPTSYGSTTLPAGLSLNTATGVITGTPTTAGTFTITDTAKNISGSGTGTLTITINPAKPLVAIASTTGTVGASFSYTISATNNPTGYGSTILPAGLSLNTATGVISGTPTVAGTFTITDTAKNISGSGTGTLTITINPAKPVVAIASATGTVGVSFSYTISATNNPTGYGSTILPAGLSLNTATGVISGTPTVAGTFTVTDTAKNISGSGTGTLTITINPAIPVVAIASTTGTVGVSFSYTISATNNPTGYGSTTLPAGLSLNTLTGAITGTPTTTGTFTITDTAKNISGSGTGILTIIINPAKPVVTSTTVNGTTGVAFSYTISATNSPTSYGASTLPGGLTFNSVTGMISGTPTTVGTFTILDTAKNISGIGVGTLTITITTTVPPAPVVTSGSVTGTVGVPFSYTIVATNSPTGYNSTTLPAGLSLNSSGIISGIPTTAGTFTITDTAKNAGGNGTGTLTITINPAKPVIAIASTTGTVGISFSYTIAATNNPTSYGSTTLPAGLSLNTATGVITGTPIAAGTFTITDTAKNISGSGTGTLTITINPAKPVVAAASTTGTVGVSFSYTISATNSPTGYGSTTLPAGLSLNTTTGAITGTPTVSGTFIITDTAKNISGAGTGTLTITINPALPGIPVITSLSTVVGTIGTAFSYNITATNTPTSYGSTALPAGLNLNTVTGAITGTPSVSGIFVDTIKATNAAGTGTQVLTITINSLPGIPEIIGNGSVSGIVGTPFEYSITTNVPALSYSATNLPAGLSINTTTGEITGTPTTIDTTKVTVTATNASGTTHNELTISITAPPVPVITSGDTATATEGESFTYNINASNAPTNYGATGLPGGLSIDPTTGIISGTPTVSGTFNITLTATNAFGTSTEVLTLAIKAPAIGTPVLIPNPVTDGHFKLTLPGWLEGESVNVEIRDFIGMLVQKGTAVISDGSITVNVPGLVAGNYVAIAMDANKKVVKKFIVK